MPRLEMRVSEEFLVRLDEIRGGVARGTWIKRAVESALENHGPKTVESALGKEPRRATSAGEAEPASPASTRPPKVSETWRR